MVSVSKSKVAMIHRRRLCYIKYLASLGIILLLVCLAYNIRYNRPWKSHKCSTGNTLRRSALSHKITHVPKSESPDLLTLVTVMCHGPQHYGANETTPSPTSRKGISRQMSQTQVMLKSLLLMEHEYLRQQNREPDSEHPSLELILYTDYKEYYDELVNFLYNSDEINSDYLKPLRLIYAPVVYPKGYEHLKYFFRPCTTLRLFMDKILPSHDSVVYLDTDLIFLKPVRELYNEFHSFNRTQWCGMGMDWYHHHTHAIPYFGSQGLNAGVGIYNLTRMRSSAFPKSLDKIFEDYLNKTKFADQDILNIYFHFHPQELKLLPCYRNYIPNYCRSDNRCPTSTSNGVTILHGITMTFMPETYETQFQETFEFFKSLKLGAVVPIEVVQERLQERLCESERHVSKLIYRSREEHCINNMNFADEILGQVQ